MLRLWIEAAGETLVVGVIFIVQLRKEKKRIGVGQRVGKDEIDVDPVFVCFKGFANAFFAPDIPSGGCYLENLRVIFIHPKVGEPEKFWVPFVVCQVFKGAS